MHKGRIQRWSFFWLLFLVCGLGLSISSPPALATSEQPSTSANSSANSDPFYVANLPTGASRHKIGIATHPWWLDTHLDTFIAQFKQLGVGTVRLPVEWKVIEPSQGQYNWTRDDRLLNRLNDEGFEIIAEFVTVPPWASGNPVECAKSDIDCSFSETHASSLAAVAEATARRYPFLRYWEFWNEPEMWPNIGRDVGNYTKWLSVFYRGIKKADPTMLVAANTLAGPAFIKGLYSYIEYTTGGTDYPWDAFSFHPYNTSGSEKEGNRAAYISKPRIQELRRLMIEKGDGHKPMWITEFGIQADPVTQSDMLRDSLDWLVTKDYIPIITMHMLHDWTGEVYGLMTTDPPIYKTNGYITPQTKFLPKQPFYDTFKNYPKRSLPLRPAATPDMLVFRETGHTVRGVFKRVWENRGGVELFGFPKTGQFYERNSADGRYYLVQYFERVRMEYHPDLKDTPYEVQFGLLGNETMVERGLLDSKGQPLVPAAKAENPLPGGRDNVFFAETGHNLSGLFLEAWKRQGGLSIIGFPRTAVYEERGRDGALLKVQYFERARLELHTGRDGRQFVLFGLLSNERLVAQKRLLPNFQPVLDDSYNPANFEFKL